MSATVEVLGLGNSLVDLLAYADDDYLSAQEMLKGAMNLIDEDRAEALYAARVDPRVISGGSAANTIVGVASFGVSGAYIGKVKQDPLGAAFSDDIRSTGVAFSTLAAEQGPSTGRCFIYVTPDGERTMNTYLGASSYLAPVGRRRGLGQGGEGRLSRGLHVGPPSGQGGVPESRRDRPRRQPPGGAHAVGFVLRRPVPRRIHRAHALADRRYDLRQHRRESCRSTRRRNLARHSTVCAQRACLASSPARKRAASSSMAIRLGRSPPFQSPSSSTRQARAICSPRASSPGSRGGETWSLAGGSACCRGRDHSAYRRAAQCVACGAGERERRRGLVPRRHAALRIVKGDGALVNNDFLRFYTPPKAEAGGAA